MKGKPTITKIISGGQTGVDRAGLEAAIQLGIPHGGWCPRGRIAEDGRIPARYDLTEMKSPNYVVRTEKNVIESDGTLILYRNKITRGTKLTRDFARRHHKSFHCVDLQQVDDQLFNEIEIIQDWIVKQAIETLNVAGPRESSSAGIENQALELLLKILDDRER